MWDMIIVGGIITLAAAYAIHKLFFKRSCGCGCSCGKPPARTAHKAGPNDGKGCRCDQDNG